MLREYLGRDECVRRVDLRPPFDAELFEDRDQRFSEAVERFLGLPDINDSEAVLTLAGPETRFAPSLLPAGYVHQDRTSGARHASEASQARRRPSRCENASPRC